MIFEWWTFVQEQMPNFDMLVLALTFKMSHSEAKFIKKWLRYQLKEVHMLFQILSQPFLSGFSSAMAHLKAQKRQIKWHSNIFEWGGGWMRQIRMHEKCSFTGNPTPLPPTAVAGACYCTCWKWKIGIRCRNSAEDVSYTKMTGKVPSTWWYGQIGVQMGS